MATKQEDKMDIDKFDFESCMEGGGGGFSPLRSRGYPDGPPTPLGMFSPSKASGEFLMLASPPRRVGGGGGSGGGGTITPGDSFPPYCPSELQAELFQLCKQYDGMDEIVRDAGFLTHELPGTFDPKTSSAPVHLDHTDVPLGYITSPKGNVGRGRGGRENTSTTTTTTTTSATPTPTKTTTSTTTTTPTTAPVPPSPLATSYSADAATRGRPPGRGSAILYGGSPRGRPKGRRQILTDHSAAAAGNTTTSSTSITTSSTASAAPAQPLTAVISEAWQQSAANLAKPLTIGGTAAVCLLPNQKGRIPGVKRRKTAAPRGRRDAGDGGKGGLRQFSMKVCERVELKKKTSYAEVANDLVQEFQNDKVEQKNIRRRVYDALNVLRAMNIIRKDKKDIHWVGLPTNRSSDVRELEKHRRMLDDNIRKKREQLDELIAQQECYQNNMTRNALSTTPQIGEGTGPHIEIPFLLVNMPSTTVIDCEMAEDRSEYSFKFNNAFEIHDDSHVLALMGLTSAVPGDGALESMTTASTTTTTTATTKKAATPSTKPRGRPKAKPKPKGTSRSGGKGKGRGGRGGKVK